MDEFESAPSAQAATPQQYVSIVDPIQRVPMTDSTERMHVLSKDCWCKPNVLVVGGVVTEVDHQRTKAGPFQQVGLK